jgi:hypothetical protein
VRDAIDDSLRNGKRFLSCRYESDNPGHIANGEVTALLCRIEQTNIAEIVALLSRFVDELVTLAALALAERLLAGRATTPRERTAPWLSLVLIKVPGERCRHGVFQLAAEMVLNGSSFPLP